MPSAPRPRVVLVDDDPSIRRFAGLVLEEMPVEFVPCADAAAARAALREAPAALLISDLMMPGESGFELLASLVADPVLRGGARLAVFSAGLNAGTRARLAPLDVWRELDKPVSVTALEACVAEALALGPAGTAEPAAGADGARPAGPAAAGDATRSDAALSHPALSHPNLSDAERQTVAECFAGDAELFIAFRAQALQQFVLDRQALAQALKAADWPALRRQAHSLKGALATLGDAPGSDRARRLEDAAAQAAELDCHLHWAALDRHLEALSLPAA